MAKIIDYTKSFKQIDKFFEKFNEGKTMSDPTRLKSNTKAIAYTLIKLYGHHLYQKKMLFVKGSIGAELYDDIPPLSTNNIRIAEKVNCTDRTVKRHIKKLVDSGLIIKKINHGRVNNYELWIDPEIIGVKKKLDLKQINKVISDEIVKSNLKELAVIEDASKSSLRTKSPLNVSCDTETKNLDNINNTPVDKESLKSDDSNSVSPKVETQETTQDTRESKLKKITPKNKTQKNNEKSSAKSKASDKYIKMLIDFLWNYSVFAIYKDFEMEDHQEMIAKQHFQKYFAKSTSKEQAKRWYDQYIKRIGMASIYFKNHPDFEIHLPSHYFDTENKKGFVGTRGWYLKYTEGKIKTAKNRILNLSLRKIKAAPKDVGVYTTAQQSVSRFKDKNLLEKFNKRVIEIHEKIND